MATGHLVQDLALLSDPAGASEKPISRAFGIWGSIPPVHAHTHMHKDRGAILQWSKTLAKSPAGDRTSPPY